MQNIQCFIFTECVASHTVLISTQSRAKFLCYLPWSLWGGGGRGGAPEGRAGEWGVKECFAYMYVCAPYMCIVPMEIRRWCLIHWARRYRWL